MTTPDARACETLPADIDCLAKELESIAAKSRPLNCKPGDVVEEAGTTLTIHGNGK